MTVTFTPTQDKILNVLKDGLPHKTQELIDCLGDSQATNKNVHTHIDNLRRKLRRIGQEIRCVVEFGPGERTGVYTLVRRITTDD